MYFDNTKRYTQYERPVSSDATAVRISEVCINTVLVFIKEEQYTQVSGVARLKCRIHDQRFLKIHILIETLIRVF
jgi:hypothetical protein